jgi:hypothetical protein
MTRQLNNSADFEAMMREIYTKLQQDGIPIHALEYAIGKLV